MDVKKYLKKFTNKHTTNSDSLNLKAMEYFMNELNHPEEKLKIIHIAGTNGKGSITEMTTNILVKNGYKVGKYISPHLIKENERISINQKNITNKELERIIVKLNYKINEYSKIFGESISLFELFTIIALYYFQEQNCDFVVLETGLGGLLDSTNIVKPIVSIISSIGYDHMNILGDTLEKIAYQKAGIIKENSNTIMIEQSTSIQKVIEDVCKDKNNNLKVIKKHEIKNKRYQKDIQLFDYKENKNIEINLKGEKQFENAAICLEIVDLLQEKGYKIEKNKLREGLSSVIHRARFEILKKEPTIIFDGAHNEQAILNFINTIHKYYNKNQKIFILSILKTKDYKKVLEYLLKEDAIFIFTSGNDETRYVSKEELYQTAMKINNKKVFYKKSLEDAVLYVKVQKEKVSFIIGSFYIYGDIKKMLKIE